MQKYLLFLLALSAYFSAMLSVTLLILWVYPWSFMSMQIGKGSGTAYAPLIDLALIAIFGLQHSVMARPKIKSCLFDGVPPSVRSSSYTLLSASCLLLMMLLWQPVGGTLWSFSQGAAYWGFTLLYIAGWSVAFMATFQIDHFELFGLHQGYRALKRLPEPLRVFKKRGFYRYVRHPIQTGTLIGLWSTPLMSYGHLLLSTGLSLYILIGLLLEEKDLVKSLGTVYAAYKKETPMLFPVFRKRR